MMLEKALKRSVSFSLPASHLKCEKLNLLFISYFVGFLPIVKVTMAADQLVRSAGGRRIDVLSVHIDNARNR